MSYLDELNNVQKEAVLHKEGPLLILAGAGSGKTRVITYRILHLIKEGVSPSEILAITFTNKAAKEMKERVSSIIARDKTLNLPVVFDEKPFVSTFHSLGVEIIRENHKELGLPRHFTVFDRSDSLSAVREAIKASGLDVSQHDAKKILGGISRRKGDRESYNHPPKSYFERILFPVWREYESILKKQKALDFDDLLVKALGLLENKEILKKYQNRWKYIHIDEYQDTNTVQYLMAKLLASKNKNICAVGDVDQNIYSWRGADIKNILSFEDDYPEAKIVTLEENYRSTKNIIEAANRLIERNLERREKNLYTSNPPGDKIFIHQAVGEKDEASYVASKTSELINEGVSEDEIAVFYRANFQSRALEESFLRANIPYQVLGTRFFERKEVKDVLCYVSLALNPDNITHLKRAIGTPSRGIGKVSLLKILSGDISSLTPQAKRSFEKFQSILEEINTNSSKLPPSKIVLLAGEASGINAELKKGGEDGEERLLNIKELAVLASRYDDMPKPEGLLKFLEEASLSSDQDEIRENKKGVKLMTIHASKGLEFDYCFIVGMEENLFPMIIEGEVEDRELEEERRLFYVALTRARKKVFLSHTIMRTIFGSEDMRSPSRFLSEIPGELTENSEEDLPETGSGLLDDIEF